MVVRGKGEGGGNKGEGGGNKSKAEVLARESVGEKKRLAKDEMKTCPGEQIDASVVILYATAMFLRCFWRLSAVFHEC